MRFSGKGLRGLVPLQGEGTESLLGGGVKPHGFGFKVYIWNQETYLKGSKRMAFSGGA